MRYTAGIAIHSRLPRRLLETIPYEIDGKHVTAACVIKGNPQIYQFRRDDGLLLGYVRRSFPGRMEVYVMTAAPHAVGAHSVCGWLSMRAAVECVVREATPRGELPGVA